MDWAATVTRVMHNNDADADADDGIVKATSGVCIR